jgi:hypothetical protein
MAVEPRRLPSPVTSTGTHRGLERVRRRLLGFPAGDDEAVHDLRRTT